MENLNKLQSKNIVQFFGVIKAGREWVGLVMEYLRGGTLADLVHDDSVILPVLLKINIIKDISDGLAFIHGKHSGKTAVHGDLKLENILLNEHLVCKISDFGSAQFYTMTNSLSITRHTSQAGSTAMYLAPERHGDMFYVRCTRMADIFSFGVLIQLLLTRQGERVQMQELSSLLDQLKANGDRRDCHIIDLLNNLQKAACNEDPTKRPTINEIQKKVDDELQGVSAAEIASFVADVLKVYEIDELPNTAGFNIALKRVVKVQTHGIYFFYIISFF